MTFGNRKFAGFLGAATVVIIAEYVLVLGDCVISGRVLGETALGAMNLLMPVFSTVSFFTWLLAVGTSIVYSEAMGRTASGQAARLAGQGLAAAVVLGLVLSGATALLRSAYLGFMAPDGASLRFAEQYWTWYPVVVVLESFDMVLLYLVYTDGGNRACQVSYVGQVVVNIVGSYLLCAHTGLGMGGISLGTAIAYLFGILLLVPRLRSRRCGLRPRLAFMPRELLRSLRASFGDASAGLFHALLFFVVNAYVLRRWGSGTLPIAAVVFCIIRLTVFFNGVGIALQPLETVYYGEENPTGIRQLVRFAAGVAVAEGLAISALVLAFPGALVALVGIEEPSLVAASCRAARLTVVGLVGYALTYMLNSHFQYIGRPLRSVVLTALAFFVFPAALVPALGAFLGGDGVWLAVATGPLCALAAIFPVVSFRRASAHEMAMTTVDLGKDDSLALACGWLAQALQRARVESARAEEVLPVVARAVEFVRSANARGKVAMEISVDCRKDVRIILRDDGDLVRLPEGGGVEIVHLPAAGFNRHILTWRRNMV